MMTTEESSQYTLTPAEEADLLDERRETRRFKYWFAKLLSLLVVFVVSTSVLSYIYDTIANKKSFETAFFEKLINSFLDFIKFVLTS